MNGNPAEKIIFSYLNGAAANIAINVRPKQLVITINDGATDFDIGDKFTIAVTKNPTAVAAAAADGDNTGNGTVTIGTAVGDLPDETITLTCIAEEANKGTFKAEGSKTGRFMTFAGAHDDLTVASAWTHVYQQIEIGDKILAAMEYPDAGGVPVDRRQLITVAAGSVSCSTGLTTSNLLLTWIDVSAG